MKKALVIILVIALFILLFPMRSQAKDGGTVRYQAILYTVSDMHQITDIQNEDGTFAEGYTVGIVIEILGVEIFNNTRWIPEK